VRRDPATFNAELDLGDMWTFTSRNALVSVSMAVAAVYSTIKPLAASSPERHR
jgi:hypothetical protein